MKTASAETATGSPARQTNPERLAGSSVAANQQAGDARTLASMLGLTWTLVRTDFKARYHGTLGGFLWALLKPVAMFAVLMGVFSFMFTDPHYKLNLIVALFLWDFFAE